jgi:hypothetical protein
MTTTTYTADRTALLIVDPYNDFMAESAFRMLRAVCCLRPPSSQDQGDCDP